MPKRSSKKKRPDVNELAASIVEDATSEDKPAEEPEPELTAEERSELARKLGRLGGLKGGKARAAKMTPKERSEAARKAALVRWRKSAEKTPDDSSSP
jgi:hypothetical protein